MEVTRKSTLEKCLVILREELRICSDDYRGLTPKKGMEQAWDETRKEIGFIQEMIHALNNEKVRAVIANWQKEVMEDGPSAMKLDPDMRLP